MRRSLLGKRVLITGASSGIGRALAEAAATRGMRVLLAARSGRVLEDVAQTIRAQGGDAIVVVMDVTKPEDRQRAIDVAVKEWGGLDVLVNNAGVSAHGHFVDLDEQILRQIMEVNFFAVAELCRLAIPVLAMGAQPLIVNVSSMCGRRGVPAWTEYSASKFAVCGFSEALRAELARFGIDLMLVVPGLAQTGLGAHLLARKGRMPTDFSKGLPVATVAARMLDGMEKNKAELRLEREARLLLFVNRFLPRFVDRRMAALVRKLYPQEIAEWNARRAQLSRP
jgi:short-subunit dehydrogenase